MNKNKKVQSKKQTKQNKDYRSNIDIKAQFKKVETGIKNGVFIYTNTLTIADFAKQLNKNYTDIIKHLFLKGINCNINTVLDENTMGELCLEFGYDFKKEIQITEENFLDNIKFDDDVSTLVSRPPIVTIMGHVDHGKTTLLDTIRKTKVALNEVGSITQKIGAYQVEWKNQLITFFDTPGHAAFSKMRAIGANLTDIVILVIAADDGIKPQTEEAIDHALNANVPIIVFLNKIDKTEKTNANYDKIYAQLADKKILCEAWGGKTIVVKGSASNNIGINELLEAILLTSEMLDLKVNPNRVANGITIEATKDKGLGSTADLLVQSGTLAINDYILVGSCYGKVRQMINFNGVPIKIAKPSTPVRISGLNGVPNAGDKWIVTKDEKLLKQLSSKMQLSAKQKELLSFLATPNKDEENKLIKDVNLILKVDNQGSLEAIKSLLTGIEIIGSKLNLIRNTIGHVNETDINLARAAKAIIITFNLKTDNKVTEYANAMGIKIKNFNIIYQIKTEIEKLLKGILDPVYEEKVIGEVEIRGLWKHSAIGNIAGCLVTNGIIKRNALVKINRNQTEIATNLKISSLKHGKETITSAKANQECGFTLENFNDIAIGDKVIVYEMVVKEDE